VVRNYTTTTAHNPSVWVEPAGQSSRATSETNRTLIELQTRRGLAIMPVHPGYGYWWPAWRRHRSTVCPSECRFIYVCFHQRHVSRSRSCTPDSRFFCLLCGQEKMVRCVHWIVIMLYLAYTLSNFEQSSILLSFCTNFIRAPALQITQRHNNELCLDHYEMY